MLKSSPRISEYLGAWGGGRVEELAAIKFIKEIRATIKLTILGLNCRTYYNIYRNYQTIGYNICVSNTKLFF